MNPFPGNYQRMCFTKMNREEKKREDMGSKKQGSNAERRDVQEDSEGRFQMTRDTEHAQNLLEQDSRLQEKYLQKDKTYGILSVLTY